MPNKFETEFSKHKCDKHYHRYHEYYNEIIGESMVKSILEIGVAYGASLKAWRSIWPEATVEGVDLFRQYDPNLENDFKIYNLDSTDKAQADLIDKTYDIIVDDGCHDWLHQLTTFNNYKDKVNKFYVIEDVKGARSLDNLVRCLPVDLSKDRIFTSHGHQREFEVDGVTKKDSYRIIFIDMR
jgi:hypothetical protein